MFVPTLYVRDIPISPRGDDFLRAWFHSRAWKKYAEPRLWASHGHSNIGAFIAHKSITKYVKTQKIGANIAFTGSTEM